MLNEIDKLLQLWGMWLSGQRLPDDLLLWNKSMFFWGRAGTIIQTVSGLLLVAEVIGARNLRVIGQWFAGKPLLRGLTHMSLRILQSIERWTNHLTNSSNSQMISSGGGTLIMTTNNAQAAIYMVIATGMALLLTILNFLPSLQDNSFFIAIVYVLFLVLGVLLLLIGILMMGYLLDYCLFRPLAWLLDRESIERVIKGVSIVLFIIGSHFSILAS